MNLIPVAAIAWWLDSPLFIDKTVDEEFPLDHAAVVPPDMTRGDVEDTMAIMAKMDSAMNEQMSAAITDVTALRIGQFQDFDSFHKGEGTATIYRLQDGTHFLRLESFRSTNGPDLRVILTPHPNPNERDHVTQ